MRVYLIKEDYLRAIQQPLTIFILCIAIAFLRFPGNLHKPFFWAVSIGLPLGMYLLLLIGMHFINKYKYGPKNN